MLRDQALSGEKQFNFSMLIRRAVEQVQQQFVLVEEVARVPCNHATYLAVRCWYPYSLSLLSFWQLPEHVRRAAMEASSDDDSDGDGDGKGGGKFEAGWGKNRC